MIYKITYKDRSIMDWDYRGAIVYVEFSENAPDKSENNALRAFNLYFENTKCISVVRVEKFETLDYLGDDSENVDDYTVVSRGSEID